MSYTVFNLLLEVQCIFFKKIIANFTPQFCKLRYILELFHAAKYMTLAIMKTNFQCKHFYVDMCMYKVIISTLLFLWKSKNKTLMQALLR